MDYIYSNINNKNIDDNSDIEVTWTAFNTLPNPSKDYYMTIAVVNINGGDHVYLCIRKGSAYEWKLICRAAGQLAAPVITLTGSVVSWTAIPDAVGYDVYVNGIVKATISETSIDLGPILTAAGTYRTYVVAKGSATSGFDDSEPSNYVDYMVAQSYFKFVNAAALTSIPADAERAALPADYKTNGWTVNYKTIGEQYEYLAYPASINALVDVVQSGQHVLDNYTKLPNTVKDNVEYHLYRTTLQQVYDDSDYTYYTFRIR